jgi:hypothetical protein
VTRKTFGAWLADQKQRQDLVGEMSRYWEGIKGKYQRVRAIPSIEAVLHERGDLAEGSVVTPAWLAAKDEYENGPRLAESPVQAVSEAQAEWGPLVQTGEGEAEISATVQHRPFGAVQIGLPPVSMELINAKLDWLHAALMSPPGTNFPPWPGDQQAVEWTWDQLHEYADHEAVQGD